VAKTSKTIAIHDADGNLRGSLATTGKFDLPTPSAVKKVAHGQVQDIELIIDPIRIERIRQIKYQLGIKNRIFDFISTELNEDQGLRTLILSSKEVGHTISSHIDVKVSQFLISAQYPIKHELDPKTQGKTKRSFGDIWIAENEHMNPINIKTGIIGDNGGGNPNMVSMKRLKQSFLSQEITSYYLAIIKFSISEDETITPVVYFIDALNFIDYLNFNFGTGQVMMKEKELYQALETNPGQILTREQKIQKLSALYEAGLAEAERKLKDGWEGVNDFSSNGLGLNHICDANSLICACQIPSEAYGHIPKINRQFL
jgi:hypothetical protein